MTNRQQPSPGIFSPAASFGLILGILVSFVAIDLVLYGNIASIIQEGRSIETATAVHFGLAVIAWIGLNSDDLCGRDWHIMIVLAFMCLRELDFDKLFTSEGLLKLRLYTGSSPLVEKLIGGAVILLILVCAYRLLKINSLNGGRDSGRVWQQAGWLRLRGCA